MQFPDHYPLNCPPDDSLGPSGTFYRFTEKQVPTQNDFTSFKEMGKSNKCKACGISVLTDYEEAVAHVRQIPSFPIII